MAEQKKPVKRRRKPKATTPEARENELIALAMDEAERQIREGRASTPVITHFLKLGSSRGRLENDQLEAKTQLVKGQVEDLESKKQIGELYENAIKAMSRYQGRDDDYEIE